MLIVASVEGAIVLCRSHRLHPRSSAGTRRNLRGRARPERSSEGDHAYSRRYSGPAVVLIIPGSGPTDRDGNSGLGVKASTYRLLAEALAERGIASARIDKRGMFASAGAVADPNHVTISDYAADAHMSVRSSASK
jgi:hypothetical protein